MKDQQEISPGASKTCLPRSSSGIFCRSTHSFRSSSSIRSRAADEYLSLTSAIPSSEYRPEELYKANVMDSVTNESGRLFFLHSAGGCGKTHVCNTIAAAIRVESKVALCVASSAIASQLLEGGRTAHSRFKIPIPVHDSAPLATSQCQAQTCISFPQGDKTHCMG